MLLSLPDTWNYSVRGLSSITPDGVDGVLTALKELERLGYLERNQQRESNGRMGRAEYVIYEMPRKKPCSVSERRTFSYEPYRCWISFFSLLLIVLVLVLLVLNCAGFSVTGVSVSGFTVYGFSVHGDSEHGFFLGIS